MATNQGKKAPITQEIATITKDVDYLAGWIKRLENPDPVLRTEAYGKGIKLYDEVARDAHAAAVLQQRIGAVVGKEWEIVPAESPARIGRTPTKSQEQKVAEFVSSVLENCNFDAARAELLKGILYGYYAAEVMWKKDGNNITVDTIIGKHPRRFIFTRERELRLLTLENMIEGEELPPRKFIVFRYGETDNPYGSGLGQSLWWPVWFKKNVVKFWLIFLEKFGMPTVKASYEGGLSDQQMDALQTAIDAIQTETGILVPSTTNVEFLEATRAGAVSYQDCCDYMDRQVSKRVIGQTLTTEIGKTGGAKAAAQTHDSIRQDILEGDADLFDSCLNETLIKWIVDYNFPGVTEYPKIKTFAAPKPDLTAQITIDKTLVCDVGLPVSKAYFYEKYGIEEPQDGDDLIEPPSKAPAMPPGGAPQEPQEEKGKDGKKGAKFAEMVPDTPDIISGQLSGRAVAITDAAFMAPLKHLVNTAQDMEDLRDRIIDLWGEMDPSALGTIIAQGMMLADMSGRYEVTQETGKKKSRAFSDPELTEVFNLPFQEQEAFFEKKLNIPTLKWDDLWKDQHSKGFMVAGAYKADLLDDFRGAVTKAKKEGITLEQFRDDFDKIVSKHGWAYNGSRDWRSQVIYDTNIRASYAAGRWEQLTDPDIKKAFGYLVYRHGDSRQPRLMHLSWDGTTLPVNDPWWKTHFVPNGWGCRCQIFAADTADYQAAKAQGKGDAPLSPIDPATGAPIGIDKGWDYNPGIAAGHDYRILNDKFETLPNDISRRLMESNLKGPAFERFIAGKIADDFPVAILKAEDKAAMGTDTQTLWMSQETLKTHLKKHPDIGLEDYRLIPEIIDEGEVYKKSNERLIYLQKGDRLYRVGVKRTKDKTSNFVLTLFETTESIAGRNVRGRYERVR